MLVTSPVLSLLVVGSHLNKRYEGLLNIPVKRLASEASEPLSGLFNRELLCIYFFFKYACHFCPLSSAGVLSDSYNT